jgi:4-amino-4-deoxy-L-arabinose transferase-like glycosyltransferase
MSPKNMPLKRVLENGELSYVLSIVPYLFLLVGVVMSVWASMTFPIHADEKVFLAVARIMRDGGLPYRDVVDNKPPGIYGLLWLFMPIFGKNLLLYRILVVFSNWCISSILFLRCRTINMKRGVLAAGIYLIISTYYQSNFIMTEVFLAACLMAAYYLSEGLGEMIDRRADLIQWSRKVGLKSRVLTIGCLLGLGVCFKQPGIVFVPVFLMYVVLFVMKNKPLGLSPRWVVLLFILGVITPITGCIIWLTMNKILGLSFSQIIVQNIYSYTSQWFFGNFYSYLPIILPTIPLWVFVGIRYIGRRNISLSDWLLLGCIVVYVPFLLFRPYHHYWIPVLPLLVCCFPLKRSVETIR